MLSIDVRWPIPSEYLYNLFMMSLSRGARKMWISPQAGKIGAKDY